MPSLSFLVVLGSSSAMLLLGLVYLRYCRVIRPPIGVFNLSDVLLTVLMILLAHIFYVVLPSWMAVGLFALAALSALYCALSPLVHIRLFALLISLVLIAGDIGAAWLFGVQNNGFLLVNNLVILLIIISISNLWVQSGLKARDAAIFSVLLALFDVAATVVSPLTLALFNRFQSAPLLPALAWSSNGSLLGGGLGDFLLVTVFSLTLYKAFGRTAGIISMFLSLLVIAALLLIDRPWPGMAFLAPLMLGQYLFWRQRCQQEYTMQEYWNKHVQR